MGATNTTEQVIDTTDGDVLSFTSAFSKQFELEHLAQAVRGDSGGAVFEKNRGVWELVGLIYAVDPLENQPGGTRSVVYGESTLIADLFRYKEIIQSLASFEPQPVDVNGDGKFSANEIDALMAAQELGVFTSCHYDVDQNGTVNSLDVEAFLASPQILVGDADLDGSVGFSDFLTMSKNFATSASGWANGDFDGDGQVAFGDFLNLSGNFGKTIVAAWQSNAISRASPVPEPQPSGILVLLITWPLMRIVAPRHESVCRGRVYRRKTCQQGTG